MAEALLRDPTHDFWSEVHKSCGKQSATSAPIVDGISCDTSIANFWRSKFEQLFNTSHTHFFFFMKILHCTSRVECKDNISSYVASTKYVP